MSGAPRQGKKPSAAKKVIGAVVAIGIIVLVFGFALPQFANYSEVWKELKDLSAWALALLLGLAVLNQISYAWVNQAALPGLRFPQANVVTLAPNMVSLTLPAGGPISLGLTYGILGSWGFTTEQTTMMVGVGGVWNVLGKFILPVVAVVVLVIAGEATRTMTLVALAGVVVVAIALGLFALVLWKESAARWTGKLLNRLGTAFLRPFRKGPVTSMTDRVLEFRSQTIVVTRTRWQWLTLAAVANQLSAFLILLAALRDVGVTEHQLHWTEALAAFAFSRVVSSIPITPGGVGIAELSFVGSLVAAGGPKPEVVAAVLIFRALTWIMPILLGAVAFVVWRTKKSWRKGVGA